MIRYQCEKCSSVLKIKDRLAGTAGKCPKCKTKFQVPEPDGADDDSTDQADSQEELSEEDAIFGRDFFKQQDTPQAPRPVTPVYDEGESDPGPANTETAQAPATPAPFSAAKPVNVDNSANIAGDLLSRTGKKNRPDDWIDPNDQEAGYDFSAINYLLLYRVLPAAATLIFVTWGLSYFMSDIAGTGVDLPPLGTVTGNVLLDGSPTAARLTFQPEPDAGNDKAAGSSSMGVAANDGNYRLDYKVDVSGAVIGRHVVLISIGALRFMEETNVTEGENQIDFKLTTPAASPQR